MAEVWKPSNRLRAICLSLLRLDNHSKVFSDLPDYKYRILAQRDVVVSYGNT